MKYLLAVGVLMTGLTFLYGTTQAEAGEMALTPNVTIGGEIAYTYIFNRPYGRTNFFGNTDERKFDLESEIDISVEWSWATARFDLNIPTDGNEAAGLRPFDDQVISIEQARFDINKEIGGGSLTITGGVFNSPIGWQHQDASQKDFIVDNFQFGLVPSNLFGLDFAFNTDSFNIGGIVANEWRDDREEELTFGVHLNAIPVEILEINAGILFTTERGFNDGTVFNTSVITDVIPSTVFSVEGTLDQNNIGIGAVAKIYCPDPILYGVTLRYDMVWSNQDSRFVSGLLGEFRPGTVITGEDIDFSIASLTGFVEPVRHLQLRAEGTMTTVEQDFSGGDDTTFYGLVAQAVYTF